MIQTIQCVFSVVLEYTGVNMTFVHYVEAQIGTFFWIFGIPKKKSFIERKEIKAKKDEEKKLLLLQEALALRQILTQAGYRNHVQSEDEDIDYHLSGYRNRTQSEDEDSDRDYHWNEH